MSKAKINKPILLFDLGGVLLRWDGVTELSRLTEGRLDREQARKFWLDFPWVRRFERGECSALEFAGGVIGELDLAITPAEFLDRFRGWDKGPFAGSLELLDRLGQDYFLACLSNNNSIHWPRIRDEFKFGPRFQKHYISHEIGLIKPDPEIFQHVVEDLQTSPSWILFLDDNPECVEGARRVGLQAEVARGLEEVIQVLKRRGILPAGSEQALG